MEIEFPVKDCPRHSLRLLLGGLVLVNVALDVWFKIRIDAGVVEFLVNGYR